MFENFNFQKIKQHFNMDTIFKSKVRGKSRKRKIKKEV